MDNSSNDLRVCLNCDSKFEPNEKKQLFCCSRCKAKHFKATKDNCFYCGEVAHARDHVLPKAFSGREGFSMTEYVPACKECNSLLNDNVFLNIIDAFAFLVMKYTKRYKLKSKAKRWSEEELEALGDSLRYNVEASIEHRLRGRKRVNRLLKMQEMMNEL